MSETVEDLGGGSGGGLPVDSVMLFNSIDQSVDKNGEIWLRDGWIDPDVASYPDAQKRVKIIPTYNAASGWDIPAGVTSTDGIVADGDKTYSFERGTGASSSHTYMYSYNAEGVRTLVRDSYASDLYSSLKGGVVVGNIIHAVDSNSKSIQKLTTAGYDAGMVTLNSSPIDLKSLTIIDGMYYVLTPDYVYIYTLTGELIATKTCHPDGTSGSNGKFIIYDGLYLHIGYDDNTVKVFTINTFNYAIAYTGVSESTGLSVLYAAYNGSEFVYEYGASGNYKIRLCQTENYVGLPYANTDIVGVPANYVRIK